LWFHDVIYDPKSKENEKLSAELFSLYASEASIENKEDIE